MIVLAHTKPMKRHTSSVVELDAEFTIRMKESPHPNPGLHMRLKFEDGSTQLVIFPADSLEKLERYARMARLGSL